jgi:hypothetical protein
MSKRYYRFNDLKTDDAVLSLVFHNIDNEKIKVYKTDDEKVCSIDADTAEHDTWLAAQLVDMNEITFDEFFVLRAQSKAWQLEWQFTKELRQKELDDAAVAVNTIEYDANESAMNRVDRILTLAGWKFNQALAAGATAAEAYESVYKITVPWKGRDNEFHDVQIESLAKAQEAAINNMRVVWEKYE